MDIARWNTSKDWISIIKSRIVKYTGLSSFGVKKKTNVAESTDMKVGRWADVGIMVVEAEVAIQSDT